jgi:hypothetical protein
MSHSVQQIGRTWNRLHRRIRELRMIAKGLASTDHPIMAHVIPMRRCNLSCAYCNEYDDHSKPVPLEVMCQRLRRLAGLGTTIVTISGGEPLLHPDLDPILERIRRHGMIAGMITNGYLLTAERIQRLNRAGLEHLQISIDNVVPDEVSKKSLKVLDKKLRMLAEHAAFHVNINSVVGGGIRNPQDALVIGRRALSLHLRGRPGALLLAAARLPRQAAARVHHRGHPPRVPHRQKLRAALHRGLRAPGGLYRFLARRSGPGAVAGGWPPRARAGRASVRCYRYVPSTN